MVIPSQRQLRQQQGQIRHGISPPQRFPRRNGTHRIAVDHQQTMLMAQKIPEMQILLHQPFGMQRTEHPESRTQNVQ